VLSSLLCLVGVMAQQRQLLRLMLPLWSTLHPSQQQRQQQQRHLQLLKQ
jgi:hypothetical protein